MSESPTPPVGWYTDPAPESDGQRWWNGTAWTEHTRPAAAATPSAPSAPPAPPAPPASPQRPPAAPWTPGAAPAVPPTGGYASGAGYGGYATPGGAGQPGYVPGAYPPAAPIGSWRSAADDRPHVTGLASAFRTVFAKYAVFTGRASRSEFWYWSLCNFLVVAALYVVLMLTVALSFGFDTGYGPSFSGIGSGMIGLLFWVWELGTLLPGLAVGVRRLRDAGFHWAFIFLLVVPILNFFGAIALLIMWCMPSKHP